MGWQFASIIADKIGGRTKRIDKMISRPGVIGVIMTEAQFEDFMKLDIRVGTIVAARPFPEARKPAFKLDIDFGRDIGVLKSSAQITVHYDCDSLIGRQVMAVVNFPPRQIGPFMSEVLTLGVPDANGEVVLIEPSFGVPNGGRLY